MPRDSSQPAPFGKRLTAAAGQFLYGLQVWTWYAHLTFDEPVHPLAAAGAFRAWVKVIARDYEREHVPVAWCEEYQQRGVVHFHALLKTPVPSAVDAASLGRLWKMSHRAAHFSRVLRYDPSRGAAWYLAKGGVVDFNVACPRTERRCKGRKGHCAEAPSRW